MKTRIAKTTTPDQADPCRITSTTGRSGNLSAERVKLEIWLASAIKAHTVAELAEATGLPANRVRTIVNAMAHDRTAINTTPGNGKTAHYILQSRRHLVPATPRPAAHAWQQPISNRSATGTYDGKELRPFEGRPGAMDAFNLPSRGIGA